MQRAALIAITALAACGGSQGTISNHGGDKSSEVRSVDWQNRTYDLDQLGAVAVHAGNADFAITDDGKAAETGTSQGNYHVEPPLFADIDGDGTEDVVISSVTSTGGTGHFSQIELFTIRNHRIVAIGAIPGGDRGDGGIRKLRLDGRAIVVERNVLGDGDGVCCASQFQVERWTWKNGQLTEDTAARTPPAPIH